MQSYARELAGLDPEGVDVFVGQSEMAALMREMHWAATPLGPVASWSQSLCATIRLMLTSRFPMWLGWGEQLTYLYNDAYAASTLGEKHPWALGKPFSVVWSEVFSEVAERVENVLRTGNATWDEKLLLFLERNGYLEETYHTFSYSPVHDDDGVIRGNLCVVTEETERVIGERRLALLKSLAEHLSGASTTEAVTAALGRALAYDARDLPFTLTYLRDSGSDALTLVAHTGVPAEHTLLRGDAPAAWIPFEHALESGARHIELPRGHWPCGPWSTPPTHALVLPIAQQGQRPAGVLVSALNPHRAVDDVYRSFMSLLVGQLAAGFANARVHEEERRRAEALAELDRAKTTFFSNVSHELRTPLTLMLGPLEELQRHGELPEAALRELQLMRRNGARLLRLVNTLLDFSRIEAGRAQASYEATDLARYTTELVSVFRSAVERAGLALRVDCTPLSAPAYVDRAMWEKIVLNLMSNAFKFTFEGAITVSVCERAGSFELAVSDTGTGIPAHEMPRLFERFHRVEGASGRTHEGTGIGLALTHELVKLHGGSVHVESALGRGSTFTVVLPMGRDHLPSERVRSGAHWASPSPTGYRDVEDVLSWLDEGERPSAPQPSRRDSTSAVGAGKRIVLADDNADMREYMRRLLAPLWDVEVVADGAAALEALRRKRPHLLVTDVMMPKLDGFGLLEAVRSDPQLRDLPVLMLSARAGEEARLEGIEAGADEYLVKPFTARELIGRVEAQLLKSRVRAVEDAHARRLASVFEHAPAAIAITRGPAHIYEVANQKYLELTREGPILGLPIREALPEIVGQGIVALLDLAYASGEAHRSGSMAVVLNRGEGGAPQQCFFDVVYQPLRAADGEVEGIAIVIYDVTELATARKQAEIANVAKDEFLAMLGHELRNPLMPIMTALELIRQRGDATAQRERLIIERQVSHLVTLVDDLLDVSRITRGKLQLHKERIEVHDIVTKAIETASPLLEKLGHALIVDVPRSGLHVEVDPPRMAQVFSNLINNAAKYTEPRGEIRVSASRDGEQVVVRVRDNGIGIAAEMLPRIFELFAQERQALDRAQGGLGLGLAIVRSLVELHGGGVEARSDGRGCGAELTVRLASAQELAARDDAKAAPAVRANEAAKHKRVLIVDDNEDISVMIGDLLQLWGYDVQTANDGVAALALAKSFEPEIAMLDIGLPVMDGYELAQRLTDGAERVRPRLIAVTGYGQEEDRKRAHAAGFVAHLVKPVDLERLRHLLEQDDDATAQPKLR